MNLNYLIKYQNLVLIFFSLNIFFWDIRFDFVQLRFFYLFLAINLILNTKITNDIIKNFFYYLILISFFFLHLYLNYKVDQIFVLKNYITSIILVLSIAIVWANFEGIKKNFILIIDFFLFTFVITTIIYYFLYYDILIESLKSGCSYLSGMFSEKINYLKGVKRFYLENSHLAMISPAVISYYIFKITLKDLSLYSILRIIFFILFVIICLHNFSFVFFVGLILSLLTLMLINFKKIFIYNYISIIFLIIFSYIFIISSDKSCNEKLSDIGKFVTQDQTIYFDNNSNNDEKIRYNLSLAVYFQNFDIAVQSLVNRPFGFGLNNYKIAFDKFESSSRKRHFNLKQGQKLNFMDGTNNLFKAIAEFGVFAIILFLFIFFLSFSSRIPFDLKSFVIPLLVVQTFLRSSGYFNGGYLLCIIIFFIFFLKYKKF